MEALEWITVLPNQHTGNPSALSQHPTTTTGTHICSIFRAVVNTEAVRKGQKRLRIRGSHGAPLLPKERASRPPKNDRNYKPNLLSNIPRTSVYVQQAQPRSPPPPSTPTPCKGGCPRPRPPPPPTPPTLTAGPRRRGGSTGPRRGGPGACRFAGAPGRPSWPGPSLPCRGDCRPQRIASRRRCGRRSAGDGVGVIMFCMPALLDR